MQPDLLPWHRDQWQQLQRYRSLARLPQALLISGKAGLGKQRLANQFAAALLCARPGADGASCGQCRDCNLLAAGTHPDLLSVSPLEEKTAIAVEQIRKLLSQASLKPQYDGYRIILVAPADALNINAANAFLKYLEEPTERSLLLLITDAPGKLPATITSRCQKLPLTAPDLATAGAWLCRQRPELDQRQVQALLNLAQGAPLTALAYVQQGVLDIHEQCFQAWIKLARQQTHPVQVAEDWQQWPRLPLLQWFARWLSDLLRCCHGASASQLSNPSLYPELYALAQRHPNPQKLFLLYDLLLANWQRQHTTVNKQLLLEEPLIQWAQLNHCR